MTIKLAARRILVAAGVVAALALGLLSIEAAATLTAAAAPPPAPPVSIESLEAALAAEQARGAELQAQLNELNGLTTDLSDALAGTKTQVSTEGKSAATLAKQLKAAQAKLAELKALLATARARLLAVGDTKGAAAAKPRSGSGGGGGGGSGSSGGTSSGGGTTSGGGGGTPSGAMTLDLSLSGSSVVVNWTSCSPSNFTAYAVVRSTDSEIHWPPEDRDTEIARVGSQSTTRLTDDGAPSGNMTYRVYCLVTHDGETKSSTSTPAKSIRVP